MSMWMTTRSFAALGLALAFNAAALAQQQPGAAGNRAGQVEPAKVDAAVTGNDMPGPIDNVQDVQDSLRMLFKLADTNNDNQISQKEAVDAGNLLVGGFFFRADQNGDGTISRDEGRQAREALFRQKPYLRFVLERGKASVDRQQGNQGGDNAKPNANANNNAGTQNPAAGLANLLDSNNDQKLSATELRQAVQTGVQGLFAAADTNRDNQLTPTEINAAAIGMARTAAQAAFQQADGDHNGSLSKDEFVRSLTAPANTVFDIFDANFDGQLTQQEMDRAQRVIASGVQRMMLPEAQNSLPNLLRSGQDPNAVAPVPHIPAPGTNPAPAAGNAPAPR